jgi:PAS domain S-box-containing protein
MFVKHQKLSRGDLLLCRELLGAISECALIIDDSGHVILVNDTATQLLGWKQAEIQDLSFLRLLSKDPINASRPIRDQIASGKNWSGTLQLRHKDGYLLNLSVHLKPVLNEHGNISAIICIADSTAQNQVVANQEIDLIYLFEKSFQCVPESMLVTEESSRLILRANHATEVVFGFTVDEVIGKNTRFLFNSHSDYLQFGQNFQKLRNGQNTINGEFHFKRKNGEVFPAEYLITRVEATKDQPGLLVGTIRDISEKKHTETNLKNTLAELNHSQNMLATMFDQSFQFMGLLDINGKLIKANARALEFIGKTLEHVVGKFFWECPWWKVKSNDTKILKKAIQRAANGEFVRYETENTGKNEVSLSIDFSITPVKNNEGEVIYLIPEGRDITEIKRLSSEIEKGEHDLREILRAAPAGIAIISPITGKFLEANTMAIQMWGYDPSEVLDLDIFAIDPEAAEDKQGSYKLWHNIISKDSVEKFITTHQRKDGSQYSAEVQARRMNYHGSKVIIGVFTDITHRLEFEHLLKMQSTALNAAANAIVITNKNGIIEYFNPALTKLTGYTKNELLGKNPRIFKSGRQDRAFYTKLWKQLLDGMVWKGVFINLRKDGTEYHVETTITPICNDKGDITDFISIQQDISDKVVMQKQIQRGQRMETMGLLAGGVAHDLNNVLTPLSLAIDILKNQSDAANHQKILDTMESSINRGSFIINQILTFARGNDSEKTTIDFRLLAKEFVKLIKETFPKSIHISLNIQPGLWMTKGDSTQLHQILMNLAINARDSMPKGGELKIGLKNVELNEKRRFLNLTIPAGKYVSLVVQDTGHGIPNEHINEIFEPFFTTKEVGKGTGLGLSSVFGMIRNHQGLIEVVSKVNQGSQFTVYLPSVSDLLEDITPDKNWNKSHHGNGKLILLVDDEEGILEISAQILKANGYRIQTAEDGVDAIEKFTTTKEPFAAVVSDIMMPNMDGVTLKRTIGRLASELPFIVWTGALDSGSQKSSIEILKSLGVTTFLEKPFKSTELLDALEDNTR